MNKISKWTMNTLLTVLILVFLESLSYFYFLGRQDRLSFSNPELYTFTKEQILQFAKIYNREMGWRYNNKTELGERSRGKEKLAQPRGAPYYALAFGDSFTFGTEVAENQTWPHHLELMSNKAVLNFGMPGYGIDQILWTFEEKTSRLHSKFAIFGFIGDDIRRARTNYWRFNYHLNHAAPALTKPVYKWNGVDFDLVTNPIQSLEELPNLLDAEFILKLMETDPVRSLKKNPSFSFPYSRLFFNEVIFNELFSDPIEAVWKSAENRALLKFILARFSKTATSRNITPVVVLFPDFNLVNAHRDNGENAKLAEKIFYDICRELNLRCFMPLDVFNKDKPGASFFLKDGHYSEETNYEIAKALYGYLKELENNR